MVAMSIGGSFLAVSLAGAYLTPAEKFHSIGSSDKLESLNPLPKVSTAFKSTFESGKVFTKKLSSVCDTPLKLFQQFAAGKSKESELLFLSSKMKSDCSYWMEFILEMQLFDIPAFETELTKAKDFGSLISLYEKICVALDCEILIKLKEYRKRQLDVCNDQIYPWEKALFDNRAFQNACSYFAAEFSFEPDYLKRLQLYNAFQVRSSQEFAENGKGEDVTLPLLAAAFSITEDPYFIRECILVCKTSLSNPYEWTDFSLTQLSTVLHILFS